MPRFRKEQKKALVFGGLLFVQLVLISLQVPFGEEPTYFEKTVFFLFAPVQKAVHGLFAGAGRLWTRYLYLRDVEAQNQAMRDDMFHLRQENMRLRGELSGLETTRELERTLTGLRRAFLAAAVIGVDASNAYKSIVIDKGARDGLQVNMPVVDKSGNLVGRVVPPIAPGEATVQLITDDNSAVAVQSAVARIQGVLAGDGKSGTCWLRYVLATNEAVAEGEELETSGFDHVFPARIPVGQVVSVTAENSLFKKIAVRPRFRFSDLSHVAVLTERGRE
jgi:rod shape-determining protein MreC